jgi:hypothetical protein
MPGFRECGVPAWCRLLEGGRVDRKTFLKTMCGLGACSCVAGLCSPAEALSAAADQAPDQRLAFARFQIAKLVTALSQEPQAAHHAELIEQRGRDCAKMGGLPARFTGDPEGYFAAAKEAWGTVFEWDKAAGVIMVTGTEGPCECPMVDQKRTPVFWCNCTVGYQKEIFSAVFGHPVQAALKASKLSGSPRCIFEIRLSAAH